MTAILCAIDGATPVPAAEEPARLCDIPVIAERPDGFPRAGDVILRSLTLRRAGAHNPHDTMQALRDFHATTLAWAYIEDADFVRQVKQSGRTFGGAAAAPSYVGGMADPDWMKGVAVLDRRGEPIIAPWKRSWKNPTLWGCVNNPELERGYVEQLRRYIDAGAQIMQRDEPGANFSAVGWGGCFCTHCIKGFRGYLARHLAPGEHGELGIPSLDSFDYRAHLDRIGAPAGDGFDRWDGGRLKDLFTAFQKESTIDFHQRTRHALNEYAGRAVPFSCNNGARQWSEIEMAFDWAFGELAYPHATAPDLYRAFREAAAHRRVQIVTMPKKRDPLDPEEWRQRTRRTIAMAYACGGLCMVPWDVYMPGDAPRYFGTPPQYADLFGFIRANRRFLDGYGQAETAGHGVPSEESSAPSVFLGGGEKVFVNLCALPGGRDAPVVIHLVDWSEQPEPFTLMLRPERFFGEQALKVSLLRPAPYEAGAHRQADQTGDYRALSRQTSLGEGRVAAFEIPALDPWAMVVVEASQAEAGAVWQPALCADAQSRFRNELLVRIESATPGAAIHHTLDGTPPDRNSPLYAGPLRLAQSGEIRAIAFSSRGSSAETRTRFQRAADAVAPMRPDADSLKASLALWLSAETLSTVRKDGDPAPDWPARCGPSATVPDAQLIDGRTATPPTYEKDACNGMPALRFDGQSNQLHVPSFANETLAGSAFTVFLVTRSGSPDFGVCGNGKTGSGGIPRLYLTRSHYCYHELEEGSLATKAPEGAVAISTFAHDGEATMAAWVNGEPGGRRDGVKAVGEFGSGGHLSMPFHSGNRNQAGHLAEIIVFRRWLTDNERRGVAAWLADRYSIPIRRWK